MYGQSLKLLCGTLILVPVINVLGFEVSSRYLPDRRDLNRMFPGDAGGPLASRVASTVFTEIVARCDCGVDLHSAAMHRTNYPNVRGDLSIPKVKELAEAFGCELVVNSKGPEGSLRRAACRNGCPTIILEAGEVFKMEPSVLDIGLRGVRNVLMHLRMIAGEPTLPAHQERITTTQWVRSTMGGIVRFHIAPGDFVEADQPIASNYSVMGAHLDILRSPVDGIALGIATLPMVKPGEPVCHIAHIGKRSALARRRQRGHSGDRLHRQASTDLATSISRVNSEEMPPPRIME
jgi:predicted deacylase